MTKTISRLYDSYTEAQRAVTDLEAAGVPHSDISIVANNSDEWYGNDKIVDRDHDGKDDRAEAARTGAGVGAASGAAVGAGTGYGAGKGALIGTGVGAAAGAIYDVMKK